MVKICYTQAMKGRRGIALVSSLLVVMSVYLMVTVMVANMQMQFTATKLDSKSVQDRYKARAACAEFSTRLAARNGLNWLQYTKANPYLPSGYSPPVKVWFLSDPRTANLLHMYAQCGEEISVRVFHRAGVAEAQIFSALVGPNGMRLHSFALADITGRTQIAGDEEPGPQNEAYSPWNELGSPPGFIFSAGGDLVPYDGGMANRYVADMRGGLFAVMSTDQGFGAYKYAGGQAWNRLPVRPRMDFVPATGSISAAGSSYVGDQSETPVWDVARDGASLWFAENVEASSSAPSGASFLQVLDIEDGQWGTLAIPPLALVRGQPERFAVKDVAAGEDGQIFLLTEPTTRSPRSRVVKYDGDRWTVLPEPPRRYFQLDAQGNPFYVSQAGVLPVESIAVGTSNELFASSPASPNVYAVSRYAESGWGLGLESPNLPAALPSRNFSSAGEYRPLSIDAAGKVILGDQSATENGVVRGSRNRDDPYTPLPSLMEKAQPGERIWSNIGGGLAGTSTNIYKATAEY